MSKASEYAAMVRPLRYPITGDEADAFAYVTSDGLLWITGGRTLAGVRGMSPSDALTFARWIIATFGEPA